MSTTPLSIFPGWPLVSFQSYCMQENDCWLIKQLKKDVVSDFKLHIFETRL